MSAKKLINLPRGSMTLLLNKLAPPALCFGWVRGAKLIKKERKKLPPHLVRRRGLEQGCRPGTVVSVVVPVSFRCSVVVGQSASGSSCRCPVPQAIGSSSSSVCVVDGC
jgi:hypothetical protein